MITAQVVIRSLVDNLCTEMEGWISQLRRLVSLLEELFMHRLLHPRKLFEACNKLAEFGVWFAVFLGLGREGSFWRHF